MKAIFIIIFSSLMAAILSPASYADVNEQLITCGHPDYPPFMWKKGDATVGVGAEVIDIIFRELDIQVVSKSNGNWKRCLASLKSGKADLAIGYRTPERMQYAQFTNTPLSADPTAIFVWKGREFKFEQWDDLKGKRAGVLLGDSNGQAFDRFLEKNIKVQYVARRLQNYKKLELGRIDFESTGLNTGLIQTKRFGYADKIIALETPVITNYIHIAISNKSKYLPYLPQIEVQLQKLHADGTIKRLIKKYIDYYVEITPNEEDLI